mmetsp:Transcript_20366/g.54455  ORF Transcript_20366/g.54455 Transcript_20366/m.54455 type:complete len:86 (+) Transcript_20366:971-1228(+)
MVFATAPHVCSPISAPQEGFVWFVCTHCRAKCHFTLSRFCFALGSTHVGSRTKVCFVFSSLYSFSMKIQATSSHETPQVVQSGVD